MIKQSQSQQHEPQVDNEKKGFHWAPIMAVGGFVAVVLTFTPVLLPGLVQSISDTSVHTYWYISRASAFVAFGLIWLSMLAGLGLTSNLSRIWPGMPTSFELHRFASLLGLGFALIHMLVLLGDQYSAYTFAQLLVPFMGDNYRPEWVGFGQLSFYALLVVAFTYYIRDRLGAHMWRLIHMLSFALFVMVLLHGIKSGTDTGNIVVIALYSVSALSVAAGSVYRMLHHREPAKDFRDATGLVITLGRGQSAPTASTGSAASTIRSRVGSSTIDGSNKNNRTLR